MRGRTNVIGVVIFNLSLPFNVEVVRGIDQVVQSQAYDLMVYTSNRTNHSGDPAWERKVVTQLNGSIIDGCIVVTPMTINLPTHHPLVVIEPCEESNYPSILAANYAGTQAAVQHLIDLGHRRIGFIGGTPALLSARQRQQGYEAAHRQAGLPILPELCVGGDYSRETALLGAHQLLNLLERPTAIMAANDQAAMAVLDVAGRLGIEVPHELSVIGFDNTPESAYTSPPLTTVDQSIAALGSRAAELLIALIEGQAVENCLYELPTRLVLRESTQPLTDSG
jgi:LacI family transcriptional regulator